MSNYFINENSVPNFLQIHDNKLLVIGDPTDTNQEKIYVIAEEIIGFKENPKIQEIIIFIKNYKAIHLTFWGDLAALDATDNKKVQDIIDQTISNCGDVLYDILERNTDVN